MMLAAPGASRLIGVLLILFIIVILRTHRATLLRVTTAAFAAAEVVCRVLFPAH
jgi:hypothetical protein